MPDFTASIDILLPADHVFDFIRDVRLVPTYASMISHAEPLDVGQRVRVIGEVNGRRFDSAGEWRVDRKAMRVEWSADNNPDYGGELTVTRQGLDSRVDGVLRFRVWSHDTLAHHGERELEKRVQDELEAAMQALKQVLERRGSGAIPMPPRASAP